MSNNFTLFDLIFIFGSAIPCALPLFTFKAGIMQNVFLQNRCSFSGKVVEKM